MSAYAIRAVDVALDQHVALRGASTPATAADLADCLVGVSRGDMSRWLQYYRRAQERGTTRYVVASRGYGLAGRWFILAKPGTDPAATQTARRESVVWSVEDMARRMASDVTREIVPAGRRNAAIDQRIAQVVPLLEAQLSALINYVTTAL